MGIGMYLSTKKRRGTSPNNANVSLAAADPGISSVPSHVCLQEDTVVSEHRTTTPAYLLTLTLGHKGRDKMLRGSIGLVFAGHWLHYLRNGEMMSDACRSMISTYFHAQKRWMMNPNCLQFPRGLFCYFVVSHHCSDVHSLLPECSKVWKV